MCMNGLEGSIILYTLGHFGSPGTIAPNLDSYGVVLINQ